MRRPLIAFIGVALLAALFAAPARPAPAAVGAPDEVGLFDPATGRWHLRYTDGRISSFYFGVPGDTPLLGDWDCDGVDTVALYRQANGFVYLRNSNDFGVADNSFFFGMAGDVPVAGDWDGDGCDTFGIFRNGRFFLVNSLGTATADIDFYFGTAGDQPFAGDFNGDGKDTVALYRPSANWSFITDDLSGLPPSGGAASTAGTFWTSAIAAVAGDWDGDGDDTLGVFKNFPTGFVLVNTNGQAQGDRRHVMGRPNWQPVTGHLGPPPPLPALALQTVATGFTRPLFMTSPIGDDRMFVVEQGGRIKIIEDGVVLAKPFLDLTSLMPASASPEQGLLGLAFHPNYASNGLFYVHYTDERDADDLSSDTRVVEYRDGPGGPQRVRTLLAVEQPASNHNGGMIQFGPDGRLHVALGDGGGGGDPFNNGQNAYNPLGAITAIDVDGSAPNQTWAIGLRNPWRFDWDGWDIFIGDVGQSSFEEINVVNRYAPKRNFGWNVQEGFGCYPPSVTSCNTANYVQPKVAYANGAEGCSVTGGFVYRGWDIDGLHGTYLYSDYCAAFLRGFVYDSATGELTAEGEWDVGITSSVPSFGEDSRGELYVLTFGGVVRKIVAAG